MQGPYDYINDYTKSMIFSVGPLMFPFAVTLFAFNRLYFVNYTLSNPREAPPRGYLYKLNDELYVRAELVLFFNFF